MRARRDDRARVLERGVRAREVDDDVGVLKHVVERRCPARDRPSPVRIMSSALGHGDHHCLTHLSGGAGDSDANHPAQAASGAAARSGFRRLLESSAVRIVASSAPTAATLKRAGA